MLNSSVVQNRAAVVRVRPGPDEHLQPQSKNKLCTDREFMERFLTDARAGRQIVLRRAADEGISRASFDRYVRRLIVAGLIRSAGGLYWRVHP